MPQDSSNAALQMMYDIQRKHEALLLSLDSFMPQAATPGEIRRDEKVISRRLAAAQRLAPRLRHLEARVRKALNPTPKSSPRSSASLRPPPCTPAPSWPATGTTSPTTTAARSPATTGARSPAPSSLHCNTPAGQLSAASVVQHGTATPGGASRSSAKHRHSRSQSSLLPEDNLMKHLTEWELYKDMPEPYLENLRRLGVI